MKEDIKAQWFRKLETQEQGNTFLRKGNAGCCWGWLCEVAVENNVMDSSHNAVNDTYKYRFSDEDNSYMHYPTVSLLQWAGIPTVVNGSDSTIHLLAGMNDNGSNFQAIMSVIEELFTDEPVSPDS